MELSIKLHIICSTVAVHSKRQQTDPNPIDELQILNPHACSLLHVVFSSSLKPGTLAFFPGDQLPIRPAIMDPEGHVGNLVDSLILLQRKDGPGQQAKKVGGFGVNYINDVVVGTQLRRN